MGKVAPGRIALMSIHPEYAEAILSGTKEIEFRKKKLAEDVTHILIYATKPLGSVIGWCEIARQEARTPEDLWDKYQHIGGISADGYFSYFDGYANAVGIHVLAARRLPEPYSLEIFGDVKPPQSFRYLSEEQEEIFNKITQMSV